MEESKILQQAIKLEPRSDVYNIEDFFISMCNKDAYESVFLSPVGYMPYLYCLLIRGGKSSGKTSLAQVARDYKNATIANDMQEIKNQEKQLYIIDNCDLWEEEDLFHSINLCSENQSNLILFADVEWKPNLLDLSSRINSMKEQIIAEPDDEMMEVIIASEFSKRSIAITKEVINYLKPRVARNYISIKNVINKIDIFSLENKKNITVRTLHNFFVNQESQSSKQDI